MNNTLLRWSFTVPFALTLALVAWAYPQQPAQVPVHWGINGQPDRWGSPAEALFLLPGIMLFATAILLLVEISSRNDRKNAPILGITRFSLGLLTLLTTASTIFHWDASRTVLLGMGLMFIPLGNIIGRAQPSAFTGLRTPWTYLSRKAWFKSQRRTGVWFTVYGVVNLICAALPSLPPAALLTVTLFLIPVTVWLIYASYLDWKNDPNPEPVRLG